MTSNKMKKPTRERERAKTKTEIGLAFCFGKKRNENVMDHIE